MVALVLASPMMMNLADDSGEIDDESMLYKFTNHFEVNYNITWHPSAAVWGGNLDPAMKTPGPPGIGIIAPPCADSPSTCDTNTTVSATLEHPAAQMHLQFGLGKSSSYQETASDIISYFYIENQTGGGWDTVYSQTGLRTGGTWETITLWPDYYNEDNTINISFRVQNLQTGQVGSVDGSWQALLFFYAMDTDSDGSGTLDSGDEGSGDGESEGDDDGDGVDDVDDTFPEDPSEWSDMDGDGWGDNSDACPSVPGTSFIDRIGCPDSDLDGWSDEEETACNHDPNKVGSTPLDIDGDGICDHNDSDDDNDLYYDDLIMASGTGFADDCPRIWGNSTDERHGCPDSDGDGVADIDDGFPGDPSRSWDRDGDGIAEEEEWFLDLVHQNHMPQFVVSLFVVLTLAFFLAIRIRSVN